MAPLKYADTPFHSSPALFADPGAEHQIVLRFDQRFIVVSCNCLRYRSSENSPGAHRYVPLLRATQIDPADPMAVWREHMKEESK